MKAVVIDHPTLPYNYIGLDCEPVDPPKDVICNYKGEKTVFLFHCPDEKLTNNGKTKPDKNPYPKALGIIVSIPVHKSGFWFNLFKAFGLKQQKYEDHLLEDDWYYVSAKVLYSEMAPASTQRKATMNAKKFVDAIGDGELYENPLEQGPYEFGANLELKEVTRQVSKPRHQKLAETLDGSIKWLVAAMVIGLILTLILLASGSGNPPPDGTTFPGA